MEDKKFIENDKTTEFKDKKFHRYNEVNIYGDAKKDNIKFVLEQMFRNQ